MPQISTVLGDDGSADTFVQLDAVFMDFVGAYKRLHGECLRFIRGLDGPRFRNVPEPTSDSAAQFPKFEALDFVGNFQFPPQRPEGREESELAAFFIEPWLDIQEKGFSPPTGQTSLTLSPSSGPDSKSLGPPTSRSPGRSPTSKSVMRSKSCLSNIGEQTNISGQTGASNFTVLSRHPLRNRTLSARNLTSKSTRASQSRTMTRLITDAADSEPMGYFSFRQWYRNSPRDAAITLMDPIMGIFIAIDCILTGISMDTEDWPGWYTFDILFAFIFSVEMLMKLRLLGFRDMYCGSMWAWSIFDTLIVGLAILDLFAQFSGSVTIIRVIRLCRLARLLRLVRVPALKELVMLIRGMVGGTRCLFWCLFSLALPIFIVGMCLSQFLKDWGEDQLFSTVASSMFTTLRCMCGDCTDYQGRPLIMQLTRELGWHYGFFYSIFILVTIFGVFNLITAIFLEITMQAAKSDTNLRRQVRKASDKKFAKNIKRLVFIFWQAHSYKIIGKSLHGEGAHKRIDLKAFDKFNIEEALELKITQQFYDEVVSVPMVREILDDMGLADDDIVDLFEMLDVCQHGTLGLFDLVNGMNKLRGDATKKDLVALAYMIYSLRVAVQANGTAAAAISACIPEDEGGDETLPVTDSDLPAFLAGWSIADQLLS